MIQKIGYARVSSKSQNLDRQLGALRAERCDAIYREKASGKSTRNRPELEKAIDALGAGDVLIVAEWDRATRSMMDGIAIIDRVLARVAGSCTTLLLSSLERRRQLRQAGAVRPQWATERRGEAS